MRNASFQNVSLRAILAFTEPPLRRKLSLSAIKENMDAGDLSVRASEAQAFAGLVVRERNPENLEFPFSALNGFITSNEQFFVRSHGGS